MTSWRGAAWLAACALVTGVLPTAAPAQDAAKEVPVAQPQKATPEQRRAAFLEALPDGGGDYEVTVGEARTLANGVVMEHIEYPSPVTSIHPDPNDTVRAVLYRTGKPEKACVIALSGWRGEPLTALLAQEIAKQTGIQVLAVQLPFQEERTPKGKFSGQVTLSADLKQNEAGFLQLVADVRRAAHWLTQKRGIGEHRLGLLGTSLGGFATGCLWGMDDRFEVAVAQLAGADVAGVVYGRNMLLGQIRGELKSLGVDEDEARDRMYLLSPSTWARRERKEGLLILAAEKDDIVTLDNAKALSKVYGDAEMIVLEGATHFALAGIRDAAPRMLKHLEKYLLRPAETATEEEPGAKAAGGEGKDDPGETPEAK